MAGDGVVQFPDHVVYGNAPAHEPHEVQPGGQRQSSSPSSAPPPAPLDLDSKYFQSEQVLRRDGSRRRRLLLERSSR